jgi:hypothetical protein
VGWSENRLAVDDWGIRVGGSEFPVRSISWSAITGVRAYAVDFGDGDRAAVLELHRTGDWEEVLDCWENFPELAAGMSAHLPGIRPDWRATVAALRPGAGPVAVWSPVVEPGTALDAT